MKRIIVMCMMLAVAGCNEAASAKTQADVIVDRATEMIASYEGFRAKPYTCSAGKLTIGYGCTDPEVVAKGSITKAEARSILRKRVIAERAWVLKTFGTNLTANQQVALISASYNIGHDGICWKTVKGKKVHTNFYNAVIAKNWARANKELQDWNKSGGVVLNGLVKRRAKEGKMLI